jgi:hypothetical protein
MDPAWRAGGWIRSILNSSTRFLFKQAILNEYPKGLDAARDLTTRENYQFQGSGSFW